MPEQRRTFGPTVLVGLASGALLAVASSKPWYAVEGSGFSAGAAMSSVLQIEGTGEMPLASALSLVLLACWGVLLVTRGRVRRSVAVLGALAALGVTATVVAGWLTLPDDLRADFAEVGADQVDVAATGWFWTAAAAALPALAAAALAVRLVPSWPEMGSRYDAPAGEHASGAAATGPADRDTHDLWKAMDEGRDPTT